MLPRGHRKLLRWTGQWPSAHAWTTPEDPTQRPSPPGRGPHTLWLPSPLPDVVAPSSGSLGPPVSSSQVSQHLGWRQTSLHPLWVPYGTEHRSPSGWNSCLKTTEPRMKFSNGILQIPEGPRGEASWWSAPKLQESPYDTRLENIWAERRWSWEPVWVH